MESKSEEAFPTPPLPLPPPPAFSPEEIQQVRVYHVHTPFSPPLPPPCFLSPEAAAGAAAHSPHVYSLPPLTPKPKFVSYETQLYRSPGLTTCTSCQAQVTSVVSYKVGSFAWLMCLVFVLCGLLACCCLIPFFVNSFKDVYHTCPRCRRVLHVQKRSCCE